MRRVLFAILSIVLLSAACPAEAQTQRSSAQLPATRIETDQKAGVIRFIVNGREEARLDATGLHVRNGISYGNTLTDVGAAGYDSPGIPAGKEKP
jgi:hypothetical protein